MNIGLGLIAADEYFKEGDRRETRDYQRKIRESELSLLPDRTEATRSGYRDTTETNAARAKLRPQQTANQETRLGLEAGDLDAEVKNAPVVRETKAIQSELGLDKAKSDKANQPTRQQIESNKLKIEQAESAQNVVMIPQKAAQKFAQGAIDQKNAQIEVIVGIEGALSTNRPDVVNQYVQGAIDSGLFPNLKGQKVTNSGLDAEGNFVAFGADGKTPLFKLTKDDMSRLKSMGQKTEVMTVNAGDTVIDKRTGQAIYTAPESDNSRSAKMGPLQRDVEYLVSAHGMSQQQALQHLNSAKTMSREQFVLKSVQDMAAMGKKATDQDVADFQTLYDRAAGAKTTAPSNTPAAPKMPTDPAVRSLLNLQ